MESLRGIMKNESTSNSKGDYVLATGNAAANRLRILHNVYGPGAYELLIRAGIQPGMRKSCSMRMGEFGTKLSTPSILTSSSTN